MSKIYLCDVSGRGLSSDVTKPETLTYFPPT